MNLIRVSVRKSCHIDIRDVSNDTSVSWFTFIFYTTLEVCNKISSLDINYHHLATRVMSASCVSVDLTVGAASYARNANVIG